MYGNTFTIPVRKNLTDHLTETRNNFLGEICMIDLQIEIHLRIDDGTGTIIFTFSNDNYSI